MDELVKTLRQRFLYAEAKAIAAKAGLPDRILPDIQNRIEAVFYVDDNGKITSDNTWYSMADYITKVLPSEAPHLFEGSQQNDTGNRLVNPDPVTFGKNLESIAKGDMVVG